MKCLLLNAFIKCITHIPTRPVTNARAYKFLGHLFERKLHGGFCTLGEFMSGCGVDKATRYTHSADK